jgi:hypothetical protein
MLIGNGSIINKSSTLIESLSQIDVANAKVFDGVAFSVSKRLSIGNSSVNYITIDGRACNCDRLVFLPAAFKAFGAGPVEVDFFFGTDADEDGTVWESVNRDNESSNVSPLVTRLNPTINNLGALLPVEFIILSDGNAAVAVAGAESKEGQLFLARQDGKYMFRITNLEASAAWGHFAMNWFEINL